MPREAPVTDEDLSVPPIRRWTGPIIDAHTHTGPPDVARGLFDVAAGYGIDTICGITHFDGIPALQKAFADRYRPIVWVEHDHMDDPVRFGRENVARIRAARDLGAVAAKFWYTPRFYEQSRWRFDHPALAPIFEVLSELGMPALVHVADPDCWFATRFTDVERYGTKASHYEGVEATLSAYPDLKLQGAHFGGDPEDLDHLRRLMDAYPNYHIDSSATKWVSRELSLKPDEARAFVIERADRIVFGSDLVAFADATADHYGSRYWVHRWLWEGKGERKSPIPDPCAPWPDGPRVVGLDLPDEVLAKLYHGTAARLFGLDGD
jgi:hypothetical protein